MASIKVKFRPSSVAGKEGTIYYQIVHNRKIRQLLSSYTVYPDEWNEYRSVIILKSGGERNALLISVKEHIQCDLEKLTEIDKKLYNTGMDYTAEDIIEEFKKYVYDSTLFRFMENEIIKLRSKGRIRTSEAYDSALKSFSKFRNGQDIRLDNMSGDVMEAYETWNLNRGVVPNTVSFYMRILQAVYNRAVNQNVIENRHPFKNVYTGVDKTVKRALPIPIIKKIRGLNLARHPDLEYARDIFILSFYLRGMSFVDMAYLRKSDLRNGHVIYRRRKTGQVLTVGWTKEMQQILNKYGENSSDYLLPIIRKKGCDENYVYKTTSFRINRSLKKIGKLVDVEIPLTLYVARHSWASAARTKGIPVPVISEGLGHESEATTRIYLANLETSVIDRANAIILRAIR